MVLQWPSEHLNLSKILKSRFTGEHEGGKWSKRRHVHAEMCKRKDANSVISRHPHGENKSGQLQAAEWLPVLQEATEQEFTPKGSLRR